MASPAALSSMSTSSSAATIVPASTRLRQAKVLERERVGEDASSMPLGGLTRAGSSNGALNASMSLPQLASGDITSAVENRMDDPSKTLLPRASTSRDIFGTYVSVRGQSSTTEAGERRHGGGSWATLGQRQDSACDGDPSEAFGDASHRRDRSSTLASTASGTSLLPSAGRDRYPSSATSAPPVWSSSLQRTVSNTTSSSTGSSDFPRTPAQSSSSPGAVIYRSSGTRSPLHVLASRKGKERERSVDEPPTWRAGVPVLSSMVSPSRPRAPARTSATMPAIIDPRFSFPMRRGGPYSSGSGSGGSGGASNQGLLVSRVQPVGLSFTGIRTDGRDAPRVSSEEMRRRGSAGNTLGDSSFVASLAARPLLDRDGHGLAVHSYAAPPTASYAAPPTAAFAPDSSPSTCTPSLLVPSPVLPTSPLTSTFTTPEAAPAEVLQPAFDPSAPHRPPKEAKRAFFPSRSRNSRRQPSRSKKGPGRRSRSSSASSSRAIEARIRSASLPNLRDVAEGSHRHSRRPLEPLEPRGPRTRSPQTQRRARDSLRRGPTPLIFPSKPVGAVSRHRPHASEPLARLPVKPPVPPRTRRNVVPVSKYEALIGTRPRVVVVDVSPTRAFIDSDEEEWFQPQAASKRSRHGALTDADVDLLRDDEHSSVLRVLRENDYSRAERAAWSDSAMRGVGFGLGLRLAQRQQKEGRRSLAAEQRRADRRRVRQDVAQRRQRAAFEADSEAEWDGPSRAARMPVGPDYSPPMPSSFEPFAQLRRKLPLGRTRERRSSTGDALSDGAGLGIARALKRTRSRLHAREGSAATPVDVTNAEPAAPKTVRGQAIRHLRVYNSMDSVYARSQSTAPTLPPLSSLAAGRSLAAAVYDVTTQYGQALTSPSDQPSQRVGEMRRPSVTTQNAFLSLPPHLHHLLRSPERQRYTPSRPAPVAPLAMPSASAPAERSGASTPYSTISAARLSLALEEHLREMSKSPTKSVERLPVATTAPLMWRVRESPSPTGARAASRLSSSRSAPALAAAAAATGLSPSSSDDRLSPRIEHPFAQRSKVPSYSRGHRAQLSRQSSASSVVNLRSDVNWNELFFLQPRRRESVRHRPSPSIETIDSARSVDAPPYRAPRDLGSDMVLPYRVRQPISPAHHPTHDPAAGYAEARAVAGSASRSEVVGQNLASSLAIPGEALEAARSSTSQTAYTTADEGLSSLSSSPTQEISVPLAATSNASARPRPTPVQSTWASTSFAREYLGTTSSTVSAARLSGGSGSGGSSKSFLRMVDGSESEQEKRAARDRPPRISSSFMDFSPVTSPRQSVVANGLVLPVSPLSPFSSSLSPPPESDQPQMPRHNGHDKYLSIDSRHFVSPLRRPTSSPFFHSDGSRYSDLHATMDDFPAPPLLESGTEDSASDGDDEDEGDEIAFEGEDATIRRRPASLASLQVHAESTIPNIAAFPVVGERPVSSQSWLNFSDSEGR